MEPLQNPHQIKGIISKDLPNSCSPKRKLSALFQPWQVSVESNRVFIAKDPGEMQADVESRTKGAY